MMEGVGEMNAQTGELLHRCMICGDEKVFKWVSYPRIDYVGVGEKI
jgi:hypothetical protein